MRKFALIWAVSLAIAGCRGLKGEYVTVKFNPGIESGSMVKSGVSDVLWYARPSESLTLRLQGDGVDMNVPSGENVTLLTGNYQVSGRYEPYGWELEIGTLHYEPTYVVSDEVDVRVGKSSYQVSAEYDCWALIIDTQEVNSVFGNDQEITGFVGIDRYKVLYLEGCLEKWTLTIIPEDMELYDATEFKMGSQENGKWYCYHPGNAVTVGMFGISLPEWEEGE